MVPNGWEVKNLEDVVSKTRKITYGIVVPGPYEPNGNLMIRAKDYSFGWQPIESIYRVSDKMHQSYKRSQVRKGDVLLTIVGSIGNTAIVPEDLEGANITQQTARLSFDEHDANFFYSIMSSKIGKKEIYRYAKSGVQPSLNLADIAKFKVPVPPLPEQQKIAKILSTWDKAISTTERLIDNSSQQKKALMQQLLTGKKRLLDDNGKPFEGEWEEVQLADLGSTFNGLTGKTKVDFGYGEKYIPYMNIFKNTFIDSNELDFVNIQANEKQSTVQFGDIFFTTSSETPEEVGMSSVFISDTQENIYLNSFCFGFRLQSLEIVSPHFIGYILRSSKIRRKISVLAQGSTRFNISKRQLVKTAIPLPSLKEQQKIAAVLTTADKEIELLEQQLADLQQEKKALMQVLLTGKKRVVVGEVI